MPASSPKASSLALSLSKVGVSLSGHQILSEITFEVARGQIAALIGPNGAGKTTLVRTMLGLVAHSGEIKVLGQKPKDVRQRVGYAPQKFEFDRDFPITVAEFLRLSSKAAIEATVKAIHMALVKGFKVQMAGLGTFDLNRRQARTGRNPQTGDKVKIKAKTVLKFRPSKILKDLVKDV